MVAGFSVSEGLRSGTLKTVLGLQAGNSPCGRCRLILVQFTKTNYHSPPCSAEVVNKWDLYLHWCVVGLLVLLH
jgi:cytidine deaminase